MAIHRGARAQAKKSPTLQEKPGRSHLSQRQDSLDILRGTATISATDISMAKGKDPRSLLPLTPAVFQILLALSDRERHGYGIMQEVKNQTGGRLNPGPGTLYGCLNRMLEAGLVKESDERPDPELDDERRKYYRVTNLGRHVSRLEAERLEEAVHAARLKKLLPAVQSAGLDWRVG